MADPTTAGGGTEGLREARELVDAKLQHPLRNSALASGSYMEAWLREAGAGPGDHAEIQALHLLLADAEERAARASAEQARVEAENARLRSILNEMGVKSCP